MPPRRLLGAFAIAALALTLVSAALLPRLRLSGDLGRLFPDDPASRALGAYVRAFGGGDVTTVLVRGADVEEVRAVAEAIASEARDKPGVVRALTHVGGDATTDVTQLDPTIAWALGTDDDARALDAALTDEGMRARLEGTRAILLMPGSGAATDLLRADPLRLMQLVAERGARKAIGATVGSDASGELVADGGHARFVLIGTRGSALVSDEAKRVVESLDAAIARATVGHPAVTAVIAGGPAIARDAEKMIRRDLYVSSAASTLLVGLAFLVTFRRSRALLAIAPPLMAGTMWTAAIAALFPGGIEAIAMGFASVVIGVGLDTGVHVYAAIVRARAELGVGASDGDVSALALSRVARPTLTAAIAAGCAFATLGLSSLRSLRELGLLCAAGEVLTAIAIVAMTPWIAARLERAPRAPEPLAWVDRVATMAASTRGARVVAGALVILVVAVIAIGPPRADSAVVAVKPKGLPALAAQEDAIRLASPTPASSVRGAPEVQLIVLQRASVEEESTLRARGEDLLAGLRRGSNARVVEGLGDWLPSDAALARHLAMRDAALADRRPEALAVALEAAGFSSAPFDAAIEHLRHPATLDAARAVVAKLREGALSALVARHLAHDRADDGSLWLATYVRGPALDVDALARDVAAIDPTAVVTGYPVLELSLRRALSHDLPRLALVALLLVAVALRTVLRDAREVLVVLAALVGELLLVALGMRALHVPLHVYDALVLPVLVGITVDESMFLLHAMHDASGASSADAIASAVRREGRAVVTTACTTAAGFIALLACAFPGLRDLGAVGALGTIAGLVTSLVVVPALARLTS